MYANMYRLASSDESSLLTFCIALCSGNSCRRSAPLSAIQFVDKVCPCPGSWQTNHQWISRRGVCAQRVRCALLNREARESWPFSETGVHDKNFPIFASNCVRGGCSRGAFEFEWLCIKEIRFAPPCIGEKGRRAPLQTADLCELLWERE